MTGVPAVVVTKLLWQSMSKKPKVIHSHMEGPRAPRQEVSWHS